MCVYNIYHDNNINSKTPVCPTPSLKLRTIALALESPVGPSITISLIESPVLII